MIDITFHNRVDFNIAKGVLARINGLLIPVRKKDCARAEFREANRVVKNPIDDCTVRGLVTCV